MINRKPAACTTTETIAAPSRPIAGKPKWPSTSAYAKKAFSTSIAIVTLRMTAARPIALTSARMTL
ncbi:hypothetical protein D3C85_1924980 [compost metagenome]